MQEASRKRFALDENLGRDEIWWRDRVQMLLRHGYRLRPRLQPGWTPSWLKPFKPEGSMWCEDSLFSFHAKKMMDAVRISDNMEVAITKLEKIGDEAEIIKYVTDPKQTGGKNHHIVPILGTFEDESEPDLVFYVAPLLQTFDYPPFEAVSEIVLLFEQLLEGLVYLHSIGVAHKDCSVGNIMMDAPSVFPKGIHPCHPGRDRKGENPIKIRPRYKAFGPINYYFIDFDLSMMFEPDEERLTYNDDGADRDVPEFSHRDEFDPFLVDVFILGNVFKKHFIPKHKNLEFLIPLTDSMTASKPSERPTAEEAQKCFKEIISTQGFFSLRRRLIEDDAKPSSVSIMFENIGIVWRTGMFAIMATSYKGMSSCSRFARAVRRITCSTFSKKSR